MRCACTTAARSAAWNGSVLVEAGDDRLDDRAEGDEVRVDLALELGRDQRPDLVAGGLVVERAHRAVGEPVGVGDVAVGVERQLADQQGQATGRDQGDRGQPARPCAEASHGPSLAIRGQTQTGTRP